jgi:MFS family permease
MGQPFLGPSGVAAVARSAYALARYAGAGRGIVRLSVQLQRPRFGVALGDGSSVAASRAASVVSEAVKPLRNGFLTLREALATPELRRVQVAGAASSLGNWAFFIVLAIYAFEQGGAAAVGLAALARMLPAGLAAPLTSLLADRRSRRDLLLEASAARALAVAVIVGAVLVDASLALVLVLAAVQTIAWIAAKPAQAALLPLLARTPEQLAATNAASSAIDSAAFCAGALLGGALAAGPGVNAGFAATAGAYGLAWLILRGLPRDAPAPHRVPRAGARQSDEVLAGFRAVLADSRLRLVVGTLAITTLVEGAIDVLLVVVAIDVLDTGPAGVGWLNAAWGAGGMLGGAAAVALLGGGRLASGIGGGCVLVGAALAGVATWQAVAPALLLFVVLGVGYALVEVAGLTLNQRLASDDVLGRVLGVVASTYVVTTAIGSAIGGVAVGLFGIEAALSAAAGTLVVLALAIGVPLARLEATVPIPAREFALLRRLDIFAPLPIATLETLAARAERLTIESGDVIVREGDRGDRCYVVAEGRITLSKLSGWRGALGPGDFFGELALLRDAPRNATAVAAGPGLLVALERDDFLAAVTGHARAREAADALVRERLPPASRFKGRGEGEFAHRGEHEHEHEHEHDAS